MGERKIFLVTGGAGFVGSHLCERLAEDVNNEVYSLDNYFTGRKTNHVPKVKYITGNASEMSQLISFKPDFLFHLGEYSRVEQSFEDIETVWKFNTASIFNILQFVRKTECKLIYAGSSTKFGDGGEGRNASPYAWTKAANSDLVVNYCEWFKISYAITYFYNVYGGREIADGKYATLIARFADKMNSNEKLPVVMPGTQQRNFTHIDDIIDGLVMVGQHGFGDGYGIGSDETYSVLDVANMFGGEIELLSERKGNRMFADLKTEKLKNLGWYPKRKLQRYIEALSKNGWAR